MPNQLVEALRAGSKEDRCRTTKRYCRSSTSKERKYNPTLINLGLECSTGKPSDPSRDDSGKGI